MFKVDVEYIIIMMLKPSIQQYRVYEPKKCSTVNGLLSSLLNEQKISQYQWYYSSYHQLSEFEGQLGALGIF